MVEFLEQIKQDWLKYRPFYLILLLLIFLMSLTLHAGMQGADGRRYLRWTHSFVFDQDLHLLNNFEATGGSYKLTPTGYVFELANIGAPLLWVPFYGVASLFLPAPTAQSPYPADATVQILWLNFSSWLYLILAGILTFAALRRLFRPAVLLAAMIAILLGTPVLFYVVTFPLSVHPAIIFLSALLLYLWLSGQPRPSILYNLAIGVVIGWLMLLATYNIVFFILPALGLLKDFVQQKNWRPLLQNGLALGFGGWVGFLPQMIVWWFLFGSPFYSPYAGQLLWSEPYILETLFSTFHGLFFYAPVLLLVIPGLWQLRRINGWAAFSLGLIWLVLAYIVSINVAWWAGSSFGNRYFLTLTPFLVWSLAVFIQNNTRWAIVLILPCILWTVGLHLQFFNGVGLTSDSIVYPVMDIARGQISAFANILNILPQLWLNRPWLSVSPVVLPLFIFIIVGVSRAVYGLTGNQSASPLKFEQAIVLVSGIIILFIALAGWRGEQTRAILAGQGFYNQPHEVVLREVKEVAGRSGLVTRAMYHEQTGQPDKAIADLKRASELWKADSAAYPTRLYLGPKSDNSLNLPLSLHLDYPGDVRLVGYEVLEAGPNGIKGELFWEKLAGEKSREVVTPIIRAFDPMGNHLGNVELESPFPAEYIPPGHLFKDSFSLQFDTSPNSWVWLAVSIAENPNTLPLNTRGEPESEIVTSVNVKAFPPSPLISTEDPQNLIGQPMLLSGNNYQPGQIIPLQFLWQSSNRLAAIQLEVSLLDSAGQLVAQQPFALRPSPFTLPHSTLCFTAPAALPDGAYRLTFTFQSEAGTWLDGVDSLPIRLSTAEAYSSPTICNLLEARFARRYEAAAPQNPVEADFAGQIKLLGYDLSIIPQAGSVSAHVILHWRAQTNINQDYQVSLQLLDAANQSIIAHTGIPVHGARPTSTWLKQELILDEYLLAVPVLAPGEYRLMLTLLDKQTGLPVENNLAQLPLTLQRLQIPQ